MNNYYTYAYLREDRTPYYIGKGKKNRMNDYHTKFVKVPSKERRLFLKQNLTEQEAFRHEKYMIAVLGRKDLGTGILINRTDGGDGGLGAIKSEENKKRMSKLMKGKPKNEEHKRKIALSNTGKKLKEETKRKISETLKKKYKNGEIIGIGGSEKGRKVSEETKRKIGLSNKGKKHSEETKKKMSDAAKNTKGKRKPLSDEHKRKISETLKNKSKYQP